jgi:hypothetical protein
MVARNQRQVLTLEDACGDLRLVAPAAERKTGTRPDPQIGTDLHASDRRLRDGKAGDERTELGNDALPVFNPLRLELQEGEERDHSRSMRISSDESATPSAVPAPGRPGLIALTRSAASTARSGSPVASERLRRVRMTAAELRRLAARQIVPSGSGLDPGPECGGPPIRWRGVLECLETAHCILGQPALEDQPGAKERRLPAGRASPPPPRRGAALRPPHSG